jgi:hypothetical protein
MTSATMRKASGESAYPFWSLTIIAVDVVALWGLCVYGSRPHSAT